MCLYGVTSSRRLPCPCAWRAHQTCGKDGETRCEQPPTSPVMPRMPAGPYTCLYPFQNVILDREVREGSGPTHTLPLRGEEHPSMFLTPAATGLNASVRRGTPEHVPCFALIRRRCTTPACTTGAKTRSPRVAVRRAGVAVETTCAYLRPPPPWIMVDCVATCDSPRDGEELS